MKSLKYSLSAAAVLTAAAITLSSCVQKDKMISINKMTQEDWIRLQDKIKKVQDRG